MRQLGDLEAAVMALLWGGAEPATVREVHARLAQDRKLAYTTVMTVMDNLHRKDVLSRELDGRAYRYTPLRDRAEHSAELIEAVLADTDDRAVPLMRFVDRMTPEEVIRLRALLDSKEVGDTPPPRRPSRPGQSKAKEARDRRR
jgi:predicted transcriptional regulator